MISGSHGWSTNQRVLDQEIKIFEKKLKNMSCKSITKPVTFKVVNALFLRNRVKVLIQLKYSICSTLSSER